MDFMARWASRVAAIFIAAVSAGGLSSEPPGTGRNVAGALLLFAAALFGLSFRRARATTPAPIVMSPAPQPPAAEPPPVVAEFVPHPVTFGNLDCDVLLAYSDSHHRATERWVTLHEFHGHRKRDGSIVWENVRGYCHERRAARTFRLSRIEMAADAKSGEIIPDLVRWANGKSRDGIHLGHR